MVQQHAAGEQIARRGGAACAQLVGVHRQCAFVGLATRPVLRHARGIAGGGERHQADATAFVDEHAVQLRVEVGDAGLVRERQAAQQVADPAGDLDRVRLRVQHEPLAERHAPRSLDRDERPVVLHTDLGDTRQVRVVEACSQAHVALPVFE